MIDKLFEIYRNNVLQGMLNDICEELGIPSPDPFKKLGIGYIPRERSWVFPERDTHGHVIGILRRFPNGNKLAIKGSKRGFIYAPTKVYDKGPKKYISGAHNWTRVNKDLPCPICNKQDWCLISSNDLINPYAVICARIKNGAKYELENCGFLHILRPEGEIESHDNILIPTDYPYLIVEGASDWAIGTHLGFTTIGKPQANCSCAELIPLIAGKDVIILGENDGGPGESGMNKTFETIKNNCKAIKLLPPLGIKDLREWFLVKSINRETIIHEIQKRGETISKDGLIEDVSPLNLARQWLDSKTLDGIQTVGSFNKQWIRFNEGKYIEWAENEVRGDIYNYFDGKEYTRQGSKGESIIDSLVLTRAKVSDIMDALNADCPISFNPPVWLDGKTSPNPSDLIVFKNGILDVNRYFDGDNRLMSPTPALFTFNSIPHVFDPNAECVFTKQIIEDVLSENEEKINLLQEWYGYNLLTDQSLEKFMLFVGRTRSGKSTLIDIMEAMLGSEQCASTSFAKLTSPFGCQSLISKLAVILSDASIPRNLDATNAVEIIKQITGNDGIDIHRKFLPALTMVKLKCRFTIAVNTLPELPDNANALIERLLLLKFEEFYGGREDRELKRKLSNSKESEGMIIWALEGLKRLKQIGGFTIPKSSLPLIKQFKSLSSPISEFVMDCCELGSQHVIPKIKLYEVWKNWSIANGQRPGSHAQLSQKLLSLYPSLKFMNRTIHGVKLQYVSGITLNNQAKELYLEV